MKKISFKEHKEKMQGPALKARMLFDKNLPSNRPRDFEEEKILANLDLIRLQNAYKSGRLVKVGNRRFIFNAGYPKRTEDN